MAEQFRTHHITKRLIARHKDYLRISFAAARHVVSYSMLSNDLYKVECLLEHQPDLELNAFHARCAEENCSPIC